MPYLGRSCRTYLGAGLIAGDEEEGGVHNRSAVKHSSHENVVTCTQGKDNPAEPFNQPERYLKAFFLSVKREIKLRKRRSDASEVCPIPLSHDVNTQRF